MKKILVLGAIFLAACAPADPNAKDPNAPGVTTDSQPLPQNGRLTLPYEALQMNKANTIYARTQTGASTVVKEYFFTTAPQKTSYQLQYSGIDYMSCNMTPVGHFYIIDASGTYTEVVSLTNFQLDANENYRLQFRTDNLNCYSITANFYLKSY